MLRKSSKYVTIKEKENILKNELGRLKNKTINGNLYPLQFDWRWLSYQS